MNGLWWRNAGVQGGFSENQPCLGAFIRDSGELGFNHLS